MLGVATGQGTLAAVSVVSGCQGATGASNEDVSGSVGGTEDRSEAAVPTESDGGPEPGLWTGTTSDGTAIDFTVTSYGALADFQLEYPACGGTAVITNQGVITVTGGEFSNSSGDVDVPSDALELPAGAEAPAAPTVTSHLESGLFDSPSSAHGDFLVEGTTVDVSTTEYGYSTSGQSLGSSTDSVTCSAAGAGTWNASWSAPLPESSATNHASALYGEPIDGQYHLGPIDFAQTNTCAPVDGYRAELQNATGLGGEFLVSVSSEHADGGAVCDACVQISTEAGRSIVARVITYGPAASAGDLDVSSSAYSELYAGESPRTMSWQLARCPDTGPLSYEFQSFSNAWYTNF